MTAEITNILFTSDLTQGARYVYQYAMDLADKYGARITFLHVQEEMSDNIKGMLGGFLSEDRLEELRSKHAQEAMNTLVGKSKERSILKEGIEIFCEDAKTDMPHCRVETDEVIVVAGHKIDTIIQVAQDKKCDLIVMGAHHRGALAEAMVGGTLRGVIKRSKTPVFLVPVPDHLT
jgi:nucleotide-binding universal stress UspA family protein